jgi:hypothetical protein
MAHLGKVRSSKRWGGTLAVSLTALMLFATPIVPVFAQAPMTRSVAQDQQNDDDPPARVGRLAKADGPVSFHAADADDWQPASVNWPAAQGNSFWTEPGARAVLELGGVRVGMAGGTEADIQQLDYGTVLVNVPQGSLYIRVRELNDDQQVLIATPGGTVQLLAGGRYHIDAGGNGAPGQVAVYDGEAALVGQGDPLMVEAGAAQAILPGNPPPPVAAASQDIDAWADFQTPPPAAAAAYIPPDMPGAADLAYVGDWRRVPTYGNVWFPPVGPDWAPYRFGHWAFVQPWGWTWVDDAAWGFAPFHYGRWAQIGGRWGWIPGEPARQPVYAPALVTFVGGGGWNPGVAIGVGVGIGAAVGWIPLGPQEVYRPWYHTSENYVRHVNVTNVTNINTINISNTTNVTNYRNFNTVTVVNAGAMTSSEPVSRAIVKVPPQALAQAPVNHGVVPVKPSAATAGANPTIVRAAGGDLNAHPAWKPAAGPMQGGKPRITPAANITTIKPLPPGPHGGFGNKPGPGPGPEFKKPGTPNGPTPAAAGTAATPGPEFKKPGTPNGQTPPAAGTTGAPGPEFKKPGAPTGPTPAAAGTTGTPGPEFKKPGTPGQTPPGPGATPPGPEFKKPGTPGAAPSGTPTPTGAGTPGPEPKKPGTPTGQTGQPSGAPANPGEKFHRPGGQPGATPTGTPTPGPDFRKPSPPTGQPPQAPTGTSPPGPEFKKPGGPAGAGSGTPGGGTPPGGHSQPTTTPAPGAHPPGGNPPNNNAGAPHPGPKDAPKCNPQAQKCP